MKSMKKLLIISMLITMIFCVSAVNAADGDAALLENNEVTEVDSVNPDLTLGENYDETIGVDENESASTTDEKIIYVGHHNTTAGGNGSYDNPFTTFKAACDIVNGEDNVIINVFNGTYYLGEGLPKDANTPLTFNTNNLNINGINGSVIIKNYFNDNKRGLNAEAFSLTSSSANFTFSNIVFDFTGSTVTYMEDNRHHEYNFVLPFWGDANLGTFYNCSFILPNNVNKITGSEFNSRFIKCSFMRKDETQLFQKDFVANTTHSFEYCIFNYDSSSLQTIRLPCDISFDSVWFGQNSLPGYIGPGLDVTDPDGTYNTTYSIPVNRYAQLSISSNYLGNNQYEILGKLTWNGTDDQDGMENFQPMTVKLTSATGVINSTATLVNGNFRTIYTSSNTTHIINYILNHVDEDLTFTTVNITAVTPAIEYGQDQIVNINFSQNITANVTVTVSNENYNKSFTVEVANNDTVIYTIPDVLKAGTYTVNITLSGPVFFGFNTTELTISKVDIDFASHVEVPTEAVYGETVIITINDLPEDIDGNVTVQVGDIIESMDANSTMAFAFDNLNATDYDVTVTYSGSDKYQADEKTDSLSVDKAESAISINDTSFTYGEEAVITAESENSTGDVIAVLTDKNNETIAVNVSGNDIALPLLNVGKYTLTVTTNVDENHNNFTDSAVITISKAAFDIGVAAGDIKYGESLVVNVTLPGDASRRAQVTIGNESKYVTIKDGKGSVKFTGLTVGKYTIEASYGGDDNYMKATVNTTANVKKTDCKIKVTAKAVPDTNNVVVNVTLPKDVARRAQVTIDNESKYVSLKDGKGSVKFTGLTVGKHTVTVSYTGDNNYMKVDANTTVNVAKQTAKIKVKAKAVSYGDDLVVNVTLPNDVTRRAVVTVDNESKTVSLKDGEASVKFSGLSVGTHNVTVSYNGDNNYKKSEATTTAKVTKATVDFEVTADDITAGEALNVAVKSASDLQRRIEVTVNGETKTVSLKDGMANLKFTGLEAGTYDVQVTYKGDSNYKSTTVSKTIVVK